MPEESNRIAIGRQGLLDWDRSKPRNYLDADPNLQRVLQMYMGESYHAHWPLLNRTATLSATEIDALASQCSEDSNLPELKRYDSFGYRKEQIIFHPSYHSLGALVWSSAVLSVLQDPGNSLLSGSLAYLLAHNSEMGHICPVACTAGLIRLLQRVGHEDQQERYLPRLLHTDYSQRLHASQFITEVQGGSDVGANGCVYHHDEETDLYHITGEKWFCSVADAGVFVMTARAAHAPEGTAGLRLFLVPRIVNGDNNNFAIRRLKHKLGTRSLATAEIDFFESVAEPIGPPDQGVKHLIGTIMDTSRVYNAVAACGMMRRSFFEAQTYAQFRQAFGSTIIDFPPVQQTLAEMKVLCAAATATTFRLLDMGDRIEESGDADTADLVAARRIHVMINKYWTSIKCTEVVRAGIEVLAGNGTIEDFSVLPRLYRDSIVLETWEGTHNTLCAQILRDFAGRKLHLPWISELEARVGELSHPSLANHQERSAEVLGEAASRIQWLLAAEGPQAAQYVRQVVEQMCMINSFVSLLRELQWELETGAESGKREIVEYFRHFYVDHTDPREIPDLNPLMHALALRF